MLLWIGSLLYYPDDTTNKFQYVLSGQIAIDSLLLNIRELLSDVDDIIDVVNTMQGTPLPSTIATSVSGAAIDTSSFDISAIAGSFAPIIDALRDPAITKWSFANAAIAVLGLSAPLQKAIVPKDENGVLKTDNTILALVHSFSASIPDNTADLHTMITNAVSGLSTKLPTYLNEVRNILTIINEVTAMSFDTLMTTLQTPKGANCTSVLCGKIAAGTITDMSLKLQAMVPSAMKSMVTFSSVP